MKIFMCTLVALAVAAAAPTEEVKEAPRDKRGIFGEPGGLLGTHLHAPLSAPLHAPLHTSLHLHAPLHAPLLPSSGLHHHDLHDHAILHSLHHTAPIISTAHVHTPVLHHAAPIISTAHVHAPVIHHSLHAAPLILPHHHHVSPSVIRIVKTVRAPPIRHIIRSGW